MSELPSQLLETACVNHVSLRIQQPNDDDFLFRLYSSIRVEEMRLFPWQSDDQRDSFLRMQLQLQTAHYRRHYPQADYSIIVAGHFPIGRFYVDRGGPRIHLLEIALLPEHRGQAIGGQLIKSLLAEAAQQSKSVTIHVERTNRALSLYSRLGFEIVEDRGIHFFMEWKPSEKQQH